MDKPAWTGAEDRVVLSAVAKYGTNQWDRVASLIARRSAAECKLRWTSQLDVRIQHSEWTETEETQLLKLAQTMPNMWASIAQCLVSRTPEQCYTHYTEMKKQLEASKDGTEGSEKEGEENEEDFGEIDEELGEIEETDEIDEKRLLAEAEARLSSNLGRKAKRKKREKLENELKFQNEILEHRKRGKKINTKETSILPVRGLELERRKMVNTNTLKGVHKRTKKPSLALPPVDPVSNPGSTPSPNPTNTQKLQKLKLQLQKLDADTNSGL